MFKALGIRDFRLLWGAGLVSSLGSWLLVLAVPAHVFLVSRSLAATGLTLAADYLPLLTLGPVAGVVADRWDRRRLMIVCDLSRAGVVALMMLGVAPGRFWVFYIALAAESTGTVLSMPALRARIPAIVGTGTTLSSANALNAGSDSIVRLVGGPLGGILLVFCGIRVLIIADALSYLISAAAMWMTYPRSGEHVAGPTTIGSVRSDLADGWHALRSAPAARALLPVTVIFLLANASLSAIIVPFGVQRLGGSAQTGLLFSALGAGFMIGAGALGVLLDRVQSRHLLTITLAATAVAYFLLFRSTSLAGALPCAVAVGAFGSMSLVVPQNAVQRTVPDAFLGRVSGVFVTGEAAATLAGAVMGPMIAQAVQFSGLATVACLVTLTSAIVTYARMPVDSRP